MTSTPAPSRQDLIAALKPCPFCGGEVNEQPNFGFPFIECRPCGVQFDGGIEEALRSEDFEPARVIWNTRAALASDPEPPPVKEDPAWPNGCIKPSACGRHRACVYAQKPESCRHYDRDIEGEVLAAGSRRAASPHPPAEEVRS